MEPLLFQHFNDRLLSREGYRRLRFLIPLSLTHGGGDDEALAARMNERFMAEVNDRITATLHAVDCLTTLARSGIGRHILTNGPADGQRRKLAVAGLDTLVDELFVSEELGFAKPDPAAFQAVLGRLGAQPGEVLVVGDSMSADVAPARALGMPALWYAPDARQPGPGTIRSLLEVPASARLPATAVIRGR
ncbi:HAD family hydrolase [Luedemannella flava]